MTPELLGRAPVVLFEGEEEPVAARWVEEILAAYVPEPARPLNFTRFDPKRAPLSDLIALLDEFPMMAGRRVVLVRDPSEWDAREQDRLASFLEGAEGDNLLILWMVGEKEPEPSSALRRRGARRDRSLSAVLLEVVAKRGRVFRATLSIPEKVKWMAEVLAGRGIAVTDAILEAVLEGCGGDLAGALLEAEKVALGGRGVGGKSGEGIPIFQLLDAVGTRNAPLGFAALAALWEARAEPIYVLSTVAGHMKLLLQVAQGRALGEEPRAMAARLNIHPYRVTKAQNQSARYSREGLGRGLQILHRADLAMKTGQMEPRLAVELALVRLLGEPGGAPVTGSRR